MYFFGNLNIPACLVYLFVIRYKEKNLSSTEKLSITSMSFQKSVSTILLTPI